MQQQKKVFGKVDQSIIDGDINRVYNSVSKYTGDTVPVFLFCLILFWSLIGNSIENISKVSFARVIHPVR